MRRSALLGLGIILTLAAFTTRSLRPSHDGVFTLREVMIPVRDGVHLQTVILTPVNQTGPLPILFRRTPYGVPSQPPDSMPANLKELAQDGYIFVIQNLRGRFKSEGVFKLSSQVDLNDPKATNETTDAYDSIDWLLKNVPNNSGKVGMYGVSYDGLTTGMTLLHPHPALKAISEQASPVDQWMNDDDHRYGALRESYDFEYAVYEQSDKNKNTHFDFETYDTYQWYLDLGPVSNDQYEVSPRLDSILEFDGRAPGLRRVLEEGSLGQSVALLDCPQSQCRGILGSGRPVGPMADLPPRGGTRPGSHEVDGRGPMVSRRMANAQGGQHRTDRPRRPRNRARIPRDRSKRRSSATTSTTPATSRRGRRRPSSRDPTVGTRTRCGRPRKRTATNLYFHADGTLSFTAPAAGARAYREYVSDPANPVPYRTRPISPTYPAGDWRTWEVADQRFVDHRPDVLSYMSAPLDHDVTVSGQLSAKLFASTSGTDADFIVKLIDVYPESAQANAWPAEAGPKPGQYAHSVNGYELPIAMEVRRGRYLVSNEHRAPARRRHADRMDRPAPRPRPRLPQGPPHHGPGPVDMVPGDRPQSAEVRAKHLQSNDG